MEPEGPWTRRFAGPIWLAGTFVVLAAWTWRKWPDALVDFGHELYIPWRLAEGDALYLDIIYKDGPLPHYLVALIFKLFGASLSTLVWANLAVLAGTTALVYRFFRRSVGALPAAAACTVFLACFAFPQYMPMGNFNFVCPYSHHQTHGFALSVLMVSLLSAHLEGGRLLHAALAGGCFGLILLTKAEFQLAAAAAAAAGLGLAARTGPRGRPPLGRVLTGFFLPALAVPVAALALLAKMGLYPRVTNYGFVLAAPAALVASACLVSVLPAWIRERGGRGDLFLAIMLGVLA